MNNAWGGGFQCLAMVPPSGGGTVFALNAAPVEKTGDT
jgi:hypothetical protein